MKLKRKFEAQTAQFLNRFTVDPVSATITPHPRPLPPRPLPTRPTPLTRTRRRRPRRRQNQLTPRESEENPPPYSYYRPLPRAPVPRPPTPQERFSDDDEFWNDNVYPEDYEAGY